MPTSGISAEPAAELVLLDAAAAARYGRTRLALPLFAGDNVVARAQAALGVESRWSKGVARLALTPEQIQTGGVRTLTKNKGGQVVIHVIDGAIFVTAGEVRGGNWERCVVATAHLMRGKDTN